MLPVPGLHDEAQLLTFPAGRTGRLVDRIIHDQLEPIGKPAQRLGGIFKLSAIGTFCRYPFINALVELVFRYEPIGCPCADEDQQQDKWRIEPEPRFFPRGGGLDH